MEVNAYDDPYIMLAHYVISVSNRAEIERYLNDDDFVWRSVLKETRLQDFSGAFLDCIIQGILDDKRRMEFMHELDKLSKYLYKNLDLPRLRKEILKYATLYGILSD